MTTAQLTKEQLLELVIQQEALITQQNERIDVLETQVRYLVSKQFGTKSEKLSADQLALFEADTNVESATATQGESMKNSIRFKHL